MSHLHIYRSKRCSTAECVVLTVEHVICKSFHIAQIIRIIFRRCLLVIEKYTLMAESCIFQKDGTTLIRGNISVPFGQSDVVPDDISCLIQVVKLVILFLDIQSRDMIPVDDHYGRLICFVDLFDKITYERIHLMAFIQIVFVFPLQLLIITGNCSIRSLEYSLCRICSVAFYGYYVKEVPLFSRLHDLHDLSGQNCILTPVGRSKCHVIHVLYGCERVKPKVRIHFIAVVEKGSVVMKSACLISVALRYICHAFQSFFSQFTLVRVFTRSEELGTYACQHLEFCIGSSCSARRDCELARCIVLKQFIEYRCRITVDFDICIILGNSKRLHLEHDNIRVLSAVIFIFKSGLFAFFRLFFKYAGYQIVRISPRP